MPFGEGLMLDVQNCAKECRVPLDKSEGVVKSTRIRFGARAPMRLPEG